MSLELNFLGAFLVATVREAIAEFDRFFRRANRQEFRLLARAEFILYKVLERLDVFLTFDLFLIFLQEIAGFEHRAFFIRENFQILRVYIMHPQMLTARSPKVFIFGALVDLTLAAIDFARLRPAAAETFNLATLHTVKAQMRAIPPA